MTSNNRNRRWAVGAAFAVALIGLANAPAADADADLDPFQDLFGDTGINSWTPSADSFLNSMDPTNALGGSLDTSVDNFLSTAEATNFSPVTTISDIVSQIDPHAFTTDGTLLFGMGSDIIPLDSTGEFALGLDYGLFASGLSPVLDPLITDIWLAANVPAELAALLVILGIPLGI